MVTHNIMRKPDYILQLSILFEMVSILSCTKYKENEERSRDVFMIFNFGMHTILFAGLFRFMMYSVVPIKRIPRHPRFTTNITDK